MYVYAKSVELEDFDNFLIWWKSVRRFLSRDDVDKVVCYFNFRKDNGDLDVNRFTFIVDKSHAKLNDGWLNQVFSMCDSALKLGQKIETRVEIEYKETEEE